MNDSPEFIQLWKYLIDNNITYELSTTRIEDVLKTTLIFETKIKT